MMKTLKRWFIIVAVAWVSLGAVVAVIRLAKGEGKFLYRAKLTEFFVCPGPDPITGFPQKAVTNLPSSTAKIYACGYLEADGSVPLHFLLFYEGKSTGWFDLEEKYQTGHVLKEIPRFWQKPGDYRVEVWLNRQKLASATFTVVP